MCLSTVYNEEKRDDRILAKHVSRIDVENGVVTLTDIMGTETKIEGAIAFADLTGGTVIIRQN